MKVKQRKQRVFESSGTAEDVIEILKTQFKNRKLYIRYSTEKTEVTINAFNEDGTVMLVTDTSYDSEGDLSIYGLSDKYIEIDLEILDVLGPGYFHCKIKSYRRASKGRKDLRFKVSPDEVVATNFRISKQTIDVSGFKIPTSVKVVLDQFQTSNAKMSDLVKVDVLTNDDKNPILKKMKKTGNSFLISDMNNPETYKALNDDFIDIYEVYGKNAELFIKKNIEKGYKSLVIVPIIYLTETEESIPFAYIQLISKSENFGLEKIIDLKEESFKLVDRIRDANTILISVHQQLLDISRGGAKLKITDDNLKKSMLKSRGFIFDLVFKLQAPITIYGEIKVTYVNGKDLYVGIDFEGNSSRKGEMKRFYSILKPMEAEYKAKLIKSLRNER